MVPPSKAGEVDAESQPLKLSVIHSPVYFTKKGGAWVAPPSFQG